MTLALSVLGYLFGFVGGIIWCWHDYPDSPQAPIFGMFITGPIGLFLGFITSVGLIVWAINSKDAKIEPPNIPPSPT
jgi:hypothetical protein